MMTAARMKGGVVKRGAGWSYVIRERVPLLDTDGSPVLDDRGRAKTTTRPRWVSGFKTQRDAKDARADALSAMGKGTYVPPQDLTVREWLERWVDGHAVELKTSTEHAYRAVITRYLDPLLGHERVQTLSPSYLSTVFRRMHESGGKGGKPLSGRTVEFARAVLRRAMNDAVLERVIPVNPVVGTKRPKVEKPKHTTWTAEQIKIFLAAPDRPLSALYRLALATGMRRGELLALQWSDVDLKESTVSVERAVTVLKKTGRTYDSPKNHERRVVTIDSQTAAALKELRKQQRYDQVSAGPDWANAEGLVFVWADGSPILPDYASKDFTAAQRGLGLPALTFHAMRHSHATVLLRAGVPVHIVAKRLGHKDPSVTLSVYADVIPDDDAGATDVYARLVSGGQP